VTHSGTGIEEYLTPVKECVTYDSEGAVADLIVELLGDKEKLRTIAAAAAARVSREHTWPHRFEEIFSRAKKRWR
jgi:spore maturation protein CgeB